MNSNSPVTSEGVIYARYSSHSQRDVSIEQQVRACEAFAKRHGIRVSKIYEDRAISGTSDKRPGFQQMIQDAKKRRWTYVIVYTLDRFARDRYDSAVYKRQLKNCDVKVLSAMENISDDPTGILMESLLEGLAEYYSKELSRKVRRGHDDNARKCLVNGALPLGYVKGPDCRYQIHEPEAEIVREIFRRANEGEKHSKIIADLNARGVTTKTGKPWARSSFNTLLCNERYAGVYIYKDFRQPGGIPAIVSRELFDSVQAMLHLKPNARRDPTGQTPQKRRRENGVYLLTGKLFCGHCKSPMIGVSGTSHTSIPHFYYTCKSRFHDRGSCDKKNLRRDDIEHFVAKSLRDTMFTREAMLALADAAMDYQARRPINDELKSLKNQLADVTRSLNNLMAAIEAGIFSATTQTRLTELETRKRDLGRLIAAAQDEADDHLTREEIIATLEMFQNGDVNDKDYQEALIDTFLVAAYVYDDKRVKFVFNLGGSKKHIEVPFNIDKIDTSGVRISDTAVDQKLGTRRSGFPVFHLLRYIHEVRWHQCKLCCIVTGLFSERFRHVREQKSMSVTRKRYFYRLIGRILVLLVCGWMCLAHPEGFDILHGMNFFRGLSPFHLLWLIWVVDMVQQIIPIKNKLPLGSMKLFSSRFRPIRDKINYTALRDYVISTTKAAYKVFIIWAALIAAIGVLYRYGILGDIGLFMISVTFYVCDLICVLIWCPFRLMMKTRCCTTCRIFNWDHLMMFSPLIYLPGFYPRSLVVLALLAWLIWELCIMMYPERFWDKSNVALKCSECTDKLCTQYCQKIRK